MMLFRFRVNYTVMEQDVPGKLLWFLIFLVMDFEE